jgi:hypothetical protein
VLTGRYFEQGLSIHHDRPKSLLVGHINSSYFRHINLSLEGKQFLQRLGQGVCVKGVILPKKYSEIEIEGWKDCQR